MSNSDMDLFVDIETCPNEVFAWRCGWRETISHDAIIRERNIVMIQYKWRHERKVHVLIWDWNKWENRDERILRQFSKVYRKATRIITQNGNSFDLPWIKGRIFILDLPPLPPVLQYDTKQVAAKNLYLNSNSLDYVSRVTGGTGKLKMQFSDWVKVVRGDEKATRKMARYGAKDVRDLERFFLRLDKHIPTIKCSRARLFENGKCTLCGGNAVHNGWAHTAGGGKKKVFQCSGCGKHQTDTKTIYG